MGRFTGVDPIGSDFPSLSVYNYASNDPVGSIDLHGMQGVKIIDFFQKKFEGTSFGQSGVGQFLSGSLDVLKGVGAGADPLAMVEQAYDRVEGTIRGAEEGDTEEVLRNTPLTGEAMGVYDMAKGAVEGDPRSLGQLTTTVGLMAAEGKAGAGKKAGNIVEEATKSGGRLGKTETRTQIAEIATELESRGYTIKGGGGRFPEEYLKPVGGGRKGGSYVDLTATHPNYATLRINTVDTKRNGFPTKRESNNGARIRNQIAPGEHLLLIPKK